MRKVADVITRVRETLQDPHGIRYTDAEIIGRLNDAVLEARSIRPDLFIHKFRDDINDVTESEQLFPLPSQFFPAVCFYIVGCLEFRDDEFAVDGRAATLLSVFGKKLTVGL